MASGCFKPVLDLIGLCSSKSEADNASREHSASTDKLIDEHEKLPITEDFQSAPNTLSKDSKILIVGGGGTIGSSTALHLSRRGYTNIHILDIFSIPSGNSAGNDLNKIIGFSTDHRGFRAELSKKYMEGWTTDPIFKPFYHATGMLQAAHDPVKIKHMKDAYEDAVKHGWAELAQMEWLGSEEEVLRRATHLKGGDIRGWQALWAGNAGWAAAREAIASVGEELKRRGVKMTFGPAGTFKEPLLSSDGKTCLGVIAEDGTKWTADRVILATGAWSPSLIDLEGQCTSKCWIIGHLQLTPEEAAPLKGIPVVYHDEIGFFFEPYLDTGIIKVCDEFPGYTRYRKTTPFGSHAGPQEISVPRSHAVHPSDTMPAEGETHVKRVVKLLLPQYKDRELLDQKMCWCTDTDDAQWLFCEDPRWKGFYLATGDSGHTFHTLPYVGHEVADMIEGKLSEEKAKAWGWRPGHGDPTGSGRGGPAPKDIGDLPGWAHGDPEDAE